MKVRFRKVPSPGGMIVPLPRAATPGSAGLDLQACIDAPVTVMPGTQALLPAGLAVEIPEGYVGLVFGRSGLGIKHGITLSNSVGVIDSDYRGELRVGLINHGEAEYTVEPGERIAQLVIMPYAAVEPVEAESLGETERADGGFGSTGRTAAGEPAGDKI